MHESSIENMRRFVEKYIQAGTSLLDVGSQEVGSQPNTSYRHLLTGLNIEYKGCDMERGQNVDIVLNKPYKWKEIKANSFDYVISGQVLEHVEFPWLTFLEIHRVLKPGGICCIIAPSAGPMHNFPYDCFRYYPDGMVALANTAHLDILEVYTNWDYEEYPHLDPMWKDTVLIAKKSEIKLRNIKASIKRAMLHLISRGSLKPALRESVNYSNKRASNSKEHITQPIDETGSVLNSRQQRSMFKNLTDEKQLNDLEKFFGEKEHLPIHKCLNYFDVYDNFFSRYRGKPVVMVEIGVSEGGSLQMWKEYFGPQSQIIGIDINPKCKDLEIPGVEVFIGDQEDRSFWSGFRALIPHVDILLDDGGHTAGQQNITFQEMFAHIAEDGIYMCEDLHTSYWSVFGGGYLREGTFIESSKKLIDFINAWHSESNSLQPNAYTKSIKGIHFYDGIAVIEKSKREKPYDILII